MVSSTLLVELGGVIFALGVLGTLAGRIGLSPIPLYLLGGLAVGLGGLVPLATSEEFIETGSEIGFILLLLTLGLEYSADELVVDLRRQARAGVLNLALNATPGVAVALLLGWGPVPAVVMGGITYASTRPDPRRRQRRWPGPAHWPCRCTRPAYAGAPAGGGSARAEVRPSPGRYG